MLADKDVFLNIDQNFKNILFFNDQFDLKSKRTKMIHFCDLLRQDYEFIGHDPLQERYRQVVYYPLREKKKFLEEFSSSYGINYRSENFSEQKLVKKQQNQFPLSLFPIC